jgi:Pvc16 N-terminal domain
MPVAVSSLSVAVQGIADFLDGQFGEDVVISVDSPQRAAERVKGGDKHFLNLFTYRVMPSGFHAASASDEPFFVRINALLTPFLSDQDAGIPDADLRILGHAIRVLASRTIVPAVPLPGNSADPDDFRSGPHLDYQLQAILQAPTMEELNHIWTTQGGELAYRLSAAYEFALIPIEPLNHRIEAGPVVAAIVDLQPSVVTHPAGFMPFGPEARAIPFAATTPDLNPAPANFLPVVLFAGDSGLSNAASVPPATASVDLAISGLPGTHAAVTVAWTRADNSAEVQPPQDFVIGAVRINDPDAVVVLDLDSPKAGDRAVISTRAADAGGIAIPDSPFANTLTLSVGGP